MRLAGTRDSGWVVIDLREVADAIASVRGAKDVQRLRPQQERRRRDTGARLAAR